MSIYNVNRMRVSGLASGLDTENMINELMSVERTKVDSLKQDKKWVEWQRDAYRDVTNMLRGLKDEFFDVAKPQSNMLSPNTYRCYKVTSTEERYITASANADAAPGRYTITSIKMAEPAKAESEVGSSFDTKKSLKGLGISGNIDGADKGKIVFNINGEAFSFSEDDTLQKVMNEINANEKAGVNLAYSSITGKLTLQTKKTGASASLNAQDADGGSNFLSTFGLNVNLEADATRDATVQLKIDGQSYTMTSPTNTFTRDGITFNLMANTVGKEIDIDVSRDVDSAFNNIKNFVEKYNGMIDKLNNKLVEKRYRDYKPLTDEQKKSMEESDIKLWEEKSKSGVLRSDPIVQNITQSMRRALIEKIEGVNISLSDIGITTGQWYENGKLYVNEEKLKDALANRGEEVEKLFCQQYKESYSPDLNAEERKVRYNNVGIMHRFSDIIQDNIRTRRDKNNKKGILLEKAGIQGDLTDTNNILGDKIKDIDKRIESLNELLYRKEEQYWRQFTAMEKALQNMSSQSMWLMQQLGLGQ